MYANHLISYGDAPSFRDTLLSPQVMGPPRPSASSAVAVAMLWRMPTAFLHIFSGKQLGGEIAAQATLMPRSVVRSFSPSASSAL